MVNKYEFKPRGTHITAKTQEEVLNKFDFGNLAIAALDDGANMEISMKFAGLDNRSAQRRKTTERRKKVRFVGGTDRRILNSRRLVA